MEKYQIGEQCVYQYKDGDIRRYVLPQLDQPISADASTISTLNGVFQRGNLIRRTPPSYYTCWQYLSALKQYNFARSSETLFQLFLDIRDLRQRTDFNQAIQTIINDYNISGSNASDHIWVIRLLAGKMLHVIRHEIEESMPVHEQQQKKTKQELLEGFDDLNVA